MRYTLPTDVVKLESSYVFRFLQQYFCMNLFFLYLSCSGFVTILWFSFYFSVSNAPYKLHSVILIFRFQKVVRKKKIRVVIPMLPSNLWRIWNTVGSVHTQIGIREDPPPPKNKIGLKGIVGRIFDGREHCICWWKQWLSFFQLHDYIFNFYFIQFPFYMSVLDKVGDFLSHFPLISPFLIFLRRLYVLF